MAFGRLGTMGAGFGRMGACGVAPPRIRFAPAELTEEAEIDDPVGTASLSGNYTGTPAWSLDDAAGGKYAIATSTGAVTVADALTAGIDQITIAVAGIDPAAPPRAFNIPVGAI